MMKSVNKPLIEKFGSNLQYESPPEKKKLRFNEDQLGSDLLRDIRRALGTNSSRVVVKEAFRHLATVELERSQSIYDLADPSFLPKLSILAEKSSGNCDVHIPIWMILSISEIIKEGQKDVEFKSIEDVINVLLLQYHQKFQYLWNPQ